MDYKIILWCLIKCVYRKLFFYKISLLNLCKFFRISIRLEDLVICLLIVLKDFMIM